ncbi:MAG: M1 family aminopeptidase [Chitinophagales bacterium]|nr:M1 family aminopeptidase [Chitinophagales bacterium]
MVQVCLAQPLMNEPGEVMCGKIVEYLAQEHTLQSADAGAIDVLHHICRWHVDPNIRYIEGSVQTTLKSLQTTDVVVFDLHDTLTVDSVIYQGAALNFTRQHHKILIPLSLQSGDTATLIIYYHGYPGRSGFGSFSKTLHDSVPNVWTLSQPYGALDWWPCRQNLADKIDSLDVFLSVPQGYTGVSNGVLVSASNNAGTTTFHWKHRYPIAAYLVAISVTNYVHYVDTISLSGHELHVHNYVYPESEADARAMTARVGAQMQLFEALFGPYPFKEEQYGHAQFGWGGGMEHQTMTFMGGWNWELMAHELAHQWFGDAVTCGSWQDIWLNEGFATYLSGLCYEFIEPQWWGAFKEDRMKRATQEPDGSVFCTDTTSVSRIFNGRLSYSKAAMILHTLRWVIGDEAFFQAIRNYMLHPDLRYRFAFTRDLVREFELAAQTHLQSFFDKWLYGEGYPTYRIVWQQNENGKVQMNVHQTTSHPSVSFFDVPIPVRLYGEGYDTTYRLMHLYSGQQFVLEPPFTVDSIVFDPDRWILSRGNTVERVYNREAAYGLLADVYPNPCRDEVHVTVMLLSARDELTLTLTDLQGRTVYQQPMVLPTATLPTRALPRGIYILKVSGKHTSGSYRVFKY